MNSYVTTQKTLLKSNKQLGFKESCNTTIKNHNSFKELFYQNLY